MTRLTVHCAKREGLGLLIALALTASATVRAAEENGLDGCRGAIGTYVTTVTDVEGVFSSRGLVTFAPDGVFLMTASGQSRVPGARELPQPTQGAWRCVAAEGAQLKLTATGLNFVLPRDRGPRNFSRVDYRATVDKDTGTISGTMEVSVPQDTDLEAADPVERPGPPIEKFEIDGKRVVPREPSFG